MRRKHQKTLQLIFARPTSGNINWADIESLFIELGAEISEREGSRIGVRLFDERRVFHRPHPSPATDKGAVASIVFDYSFCYYGPSDAIAYLTIRGACSTFVL